MLFYNNVSVNRVSVVVSFRRGVREVGVRSRGMEFFFCFAWLRVLLLCFYIKKLPDIKKLSREAGVGQTVALATSPLVFERHPFEI